MALNYTGYYELMETLNTAFEADPDCRKVTFGDVDAYDIEKDTITPTAHLSPGSVNIGENSISFTVQVLIYDLISNRKLTEDEKIDPSNGSNNTQDCLDTCLAILLRVIRPYVRTKTLETSEVILANQPSFQFVTDQGNSGLAGVFGTLEFRLIDHASKC